MPTVLHPIMLSPKLLLTLSLILLIHACAPQPAFGDLIPTQHSTLFSTTARYDNSPRTPWAIFLGPVSQPVSHPDHTIVRSRTHGVITPHVPGIWKILDSLVTGPTPHWLIEEGPGQNFPHHRASPLSTWGSDIAASPTHAPGPPSKPGPPSWKPGPPPWHTEPPPVIPEPASGVLLLAGALLMLFRPTR